MFGVLMNDPEDRTGSHCQYLRPIYSLLHCCTVYPSRLILRTPCEFSDMECARLGDGVLVGFYADAVSADGRRELELLEEAGCGRVFGPAALLPEDVIEYLRPGDTLLVVTLFRLATSLPGLILLFERLQEAGVGVHAIDNRVVPGTTIGDAFGQVCSILAGLHRAATSGAAKEKRGRRGRPIMLTPEDQARAERLLKRASVIEVARLLKVSPATIYRHFPRRGLGAAARRSDKSAKLRQPSAKR